MKHAPKQPAAPTPLTTFPPGYPGAHPIADSYPLTEEDVAQMMADMKQRQKRKSEPQMNTIQLLADGRIIDGRTRWIACARLGLVPRTAKLAPGATDETLQAFVRSLNDVRRHSAPAGMKAMLLLEAMETPLPQQGGDRKSAPGSNRTVRVADLAEQAGISTRAMEQAVLVKKHGDKELQKEVKSGKVSLKQAEKRVRAVRTPKAPETPSEEASEAVNEAPVEEVQEAAPLEVLDPGLQQNLRQMVNLLPPTFREWLRVMLEDMNPAQQAQVLAFLPTALAEAAAPSARETTKVCLDLLALAPALSDDARKVQGVLRWYQKQPECQPATEAPAEAAPGPQ